MIENAGGKNLKVKGGFFVPLVILIVLVGGVVLYLYFTGARGGIKTGQGVSSSSQKAAGGCDFNADGKVDGKDADIAKKSFGPVSDDGINSTRFDVNYDKQVDAADIAIITKNEPKYCALKVDSSKKPS